MNLIYADFFLHIIKKPTSALRLNLKDFAHAKSDVTITDKGKGMGFTILFLRKMHANFGQYLWCDSSMVILQKTCTNQLYLDDLAHMKCKYANILGN